jgi:hypothetical protein
MEGSEVQGYNCDNFERRTLSAEPFFSFFLLTAGWKAGHKMPTYLFVVDSGCQHLS